VRCPARRGIIPAAAAAILLAALAEPAQAGSIRGSVELVKASDAERTVVYVESVPEGSFPAPARAVRLSQKGANFSPSVLPVVRGSQVDMSNDDWVSHNAFSKSAAKSFDLGIYAQDARKLVTFEKLGVVEIFCSIHPRMNAVILVLQNPFFAKPARDGQFAIDDLPAGTYTVKTYRPGMEPTSAVVKVPASGSIEARL
jgi:plastocyanin